MAKKTADKPATNDQAITPQQARLNYNYAEGLMRLRARDYMGSNYR